MASIRKEMMIDAPANHVWDAIRDALPQFTPNECANMFKAAGYEPE